MKRITIIIHAGFLFVSLSQITDESHILGLRYSSNRFFGSRTFVQLTRQSKLRSHNAIMDLRRASQNFAQSKSKKWIMPHWIRSKLRVRSLRVEPYPELRFWAAEADIRDQIRNFRVKVTAYKSFGEFDHLQDSTLFIRFSQLPFYSRYSIGFHKFHDHLSDTKDNSDFTKRTFVPRDQETNSP